MATVRSLPAQDIGPGGGSVGSSRPADREGVAIGPGFVLARIPDVSVDRSKTSSQEPESPDPDPSTVKRMYRLDPPATFRPHATLTASEPGGADSSSAGGTTTSAAHKLPRARRLPLWAKPAEGSSRARPSAQAAGTGASQEFTRSLVRFLVLVALFTAAGLSIRLMKSSPRQPTTAPPEATSATDPSVGAPTTASDQQQASEFSHVDQGVRMVSENVALTADQPPPVARLLGNVLEAPAHQAQHDHNESNIH